MAPAREKRDFQAVAGVRLYETGRSAMRRGEIGLHVKGIQRDTDILKDFELLRRLALI